MWVWLMRMVLAVFPGQCLHLQVCCMRQAFYNQEQAEYYTHPLTMRHVAIPSTSFMARGEPSQTKLNVISYNTVDASSHDWLATNPSRPRPPTRMTKACIVRGCTRDIPPDGGSKTGLWGHAIWQSWSSKNRDLSRINLMSSIWAQNRNKTFI